jgi:hypothetical protein
MKTDPLLEIMGVVLVLVLVLFFVAMPRRGKHWGPWGWGAGNAAHVGKLGERQTVAAARLLLSSDYTDINDITIKTRWGTTQIDHAIVSRYGVFVVETKNMNGWIFGHEDSPSWTKLNRGHKLRFQNPLLQNAGHIKALSNAARIPLEKMHSVVVFQGDCALKTQLPENVLTDGYINYVKSKSKVVFTDDEVKRMVATINAVMLPQTEETREQHVAHLKERFGSTTTCGRCGSRLVLRTTRTGRNVGKQFLGCSRYPSCRYVRELPTR